MSDILQDEENSQSHKQRITKAEEQVAVAPKRSESFKCVPGFYTIIDLSYLARLGDRHV